MKYNFVYDTDFLEKNAVCLSEEEKTVVFATVIGKHNAIFCGYKPERLVEAIKKLTSDCPFVEISNLSTIEDDLQKAEGGVLCMKNFDSWSIIDQQYLYSFSVNNEQRLSQFIATATLNPLETVVPDMINNFDIIYTCKDGAKLPYPKERVTNVFKVIKDYHCRLHSGRFVTSTELKLDTYWLTNSAYSYICKLGEDNPVIARKVSLIARSVSDCLNNNLTEMDDIDIAKKMCGVWKEEKATTLYEELW